MKPVGRALISSHLFLRQTSFGAAAFLGAALCVLPAGCKRERAVAPAPASLPPLSAPGATATHPSTNPHGMPADHPPVLQGRPWADTHAPQPAEANPAPSPQTTLRGALTLDPKLADKVKPGAVIFLAARAAQNGAPVGPPLAVKRLVAASWPLPFELSAADAMMPGLSLQGQVIITARVDQDEDAMTKSPGDIEGVSVPLSVPNPSVQLVLDKVRTEAAGGPSPAGMGAGMGGGMGATHSPH